MTATLVSHSLATSALHGRLDKGTNEHTLHGTANHFGTTFQIAENR